MTSGFPGTYSPQQLATGRPATGLTSPGAARTSFAQRLQQVTSAAAGGGAQYNLLGDARIIPDVRSNSLIVYAGKEDFKMLTNIVAKIDTLLAQVLIESIILEVSLGDSQNISVSAARRDQTGSTNNFASLMNNGLGFLNFAGNTNISSLGNNAPSGFTWFGQFGDDFALALNLAAQDNRIKVLSRPSVQTSHAVAANLFVGETRPYITGSYYSDFGGVSGRSQYTQLQIGLQLQVLPLINPEGLVVMDISQSVQQVAGSVNIDGNDVPITQDQNANAKVAVKDRDTIILGGFIQNTMSRNESGVPFLKDIPLLGNLFKSKNRNDNRRELMVLIRPTVLETPDDAAKLVNNRKNLTPNVKEAEVDFELEQEKHLERANESIMRKRLGLPER
jgi:general secretion pathway protein D